MYKKKTSVDKCEMDHSNRNALMKHNKPVNLDYNNAEKRIKTNKILLNSLANRGLIRNS